jgi:hypothetical protein
VGIVDLAAQFTGCAYFLIIYDKLVRAAKFMQLPGGMHLLKYYIGLFCGWANLPFRITLRNPKSGWYTDPCIKGSVDAVYSIADAQQNWVWIVYTLAEIAKRTNKNIFICSLKPS